MKTRLLLIPFITFFLLAAAASPVLAHALLLRSVPAANADLSRSPAQVELFFSEPLEPSFSAISVLDSGGVVVDDGDSRVDPADPTHLTVSLRSLPDGVYTVSWRALSSADGHRTTGAFPFAVGNVDASAMAAQNTSSAIQVSLGGVLARWLLYLSAIALAGGALFLLFVWEPAFESIRAEVSQVGYRPPWRNLALEVLIVFSVAQVLGLLLEAGQAVGGEFAPPWSGAVNTLLFSTRYGALWLARFALALVVTGLLPAARARRDHWLAFAAGTALLLAISLGSHAAAEVQPVVPVLADWLHLLAASVWVGGLIHFIAGLRAILTLDPGLRTRLTARLIPRFSALAIGSVALLALTGLYSALLRVGTLQALAGSLYGLTLLTKVGLVLAMLGLGATNLLITTPAMKRAAATAGGRPVLVARFRRIVTGEVALGVAVLLAVGLLTSLPPARTIQTPSGLSAETRADDLDVTVDITPGRVGVNTFTAHISAGGQPLQTAKEVMLRFTPSTVNVPPTSLQLAGQGNGAFSAQGSYLSLPGEWQVQVVVRRNGQFDSFANLTFNLNSGGANQTQSWNRITGLLLLACACAFAFALRPLSRRRERFAMFGLAPAVALVVAGLVVYTRPAVAENTTLVNPIPPNAASIADGKMLYESNCVICHGPGGKGDGPVGLTLNPRPADLTVHTAPGVHTDATLYDWISHGFPGSVMPAFQGRLTDQQRWDLVNYIRTLAAK